MAEPIEAVEALSETQKKNPYEKWEELAASQLPECAGWAGAMAPRSLGKILIDAQDRIHQAVSENKRREFAHLKQLRERNEALFQKVRHHPAESRDFSTREVVKIQKT